MAIPFKQANAYVLRGMIRERNDCTVRAVATATGKPYHEVHAAAARAGRKQFGGFHTEAVLRYAGVTYSRINTRPLASQRMVESGRASWRYGNKSIAPTLSQIMPLLQKGRYVVTTYSHAFAVIDGVVHDHDTSTQGPRSRVLTIYELL